VRLVSNLAASFARPTLACRRRGYRRAPEKVRVIPASLAREGDFSTRPAPEADRWAARRNHSSWQIWHDVIEQVQTQELNTKPFVHLLASTLSGVLLASALMFLFSSLPSSAQAKMSSPIMQSSFSPNRPGTSLTSTLSFTLHLSLVFKYYASEQLAFWSERDDGTPEIYVMNPDGSGQTRLTNNHPIWDAYPNWSPDGMQITYYCGGICVMNADGSGQTRLTNNGSSPAWSPDGTRIAFHAGAYPDFDIYIMNTDGSGQTRLTNDPSFDQLPEWSPDGTKLVFIARRDGDDEIYSMNTDGSGQTQLTSNTVPDLAPVWSPDGLRIAFSSLRNGNYEIYVMNADGSGQIRLTNNPADDHNPTWSPDGARIAFSSNREGNHEIYVMNSDGSGPTRLTNNLARDMDPAWSQ